MTTGRRAAVTLEGLPLCGLAAADGGTTALEWTPEALRTGEDAGANLVVRQAPAVAGVHRVGARRRFGLPGFLADSLPDAWGRLLVDRAARRAGLDPARLEGLERLLIVGDGGPGALAFAPATVFSGEVGGCDAALDGGLDAIAAATRRVLEGHDDDLLDALARHGGSAGGTRPKVWLAVGPDGSLRGGAGPLAADETGFLVKFRAPAFDPPDIAVIELAYARMAEAAGLVVAEPRLFTGRRGRYFGSRRFDRAGMRRIHVLSAAAVLDVEAEASHGFDAVDLLRLTRHVTRDERAVTEAYRHVVFNVLSHNRDDHLRQFAFQRAAPLCASPAPGGGWQRTPAYDLTFSEGPGGEHTLLVAGEGRAPGRAALRRLAEAAGVPVEHAMGIQAAVADAVSGWAGFARAAGVGAASRRRIEAAVTRCLRAP